MHSAKLPRRAGPARSMHMLAVTAALASIGLFMPAWVNAAQPAQVAQVAQATPAASASTQAVDTSIRPFQFHASEQSLKDLRQRIVATKWPSRELVNDGTQGVQLETMKKLAQYWANDYDWRRVESKLNALPQFVTNIDGVDIHFIHVRSKNKNALPIIVTHGWPGSVVEQLKLIDPLTNPTAHGGSADDAFDVVIPSLPGYGFSGKPNELGWDPAHIARAWEELMRRLGYQHYVAQGGDWGDAVTEQMAVQAPPGLLAIHTNMPGAVPDEIQRSLDAHKPAPANLSADEKRAYEQLDFFYSHGLAYAQEMTARPQTLYGIEDSPVGLAAWMLDHDARSYELIARVFDGKQEGLTRDDVLDNITLYWLTNTAVSSARLYWENKFAFFAPKGIKIPVAVSAFPDELYQAPESWAKRAFPNLIYYSRQAKGGHFAAWEQPDALTHDLRLAFRQVR
ncbi:multidrug MFS transporter [Pandoraea anapnoica]|uniref:Multidrug MFS transporter n=1 Tax=Pandoraea anapnoica TaxID=2508301 RepID=A0A5E5ABJ6_9BURK|nr:epoxide hydrolase family protein [Pandoraea anapnoica]VVE69480.1 multidrug MFS transporter [Pandoraea anapnoica]